MKFDFSPYELIGNPKTASRAHSRKGALLRVEFSPAVVGFADCHPWEKRGDVPLIKQLSLLKKGVTTPLTEQSLFFAQHDAEARQNRVSCFADLTIPRSHALFLSLHPSAIASFPSLVANGFSVCKIKIGKKDRAHLEPLLKQLKELPTFRLRLDANEQFSLEEWRSFSKDLEPLSPWIEYIEDPFPYDPMLWEEAQKESPFRFACDRSSARAIGKENSAPFLVLKPAIQSATPFTLAPPEQTVLVTSYLDHPLGQAQAAWLAASWKRETPERLGLCGLISHTCYQENPFSKSFTLQGDQLLPPEGTGFGFDALLKEQRWIPL